MRFTALIRRVDTSEDEEQIWEAACYQLDLAARGASEDDALENLIEEIRQYLELHPDYEEAGGRQPGLPFEV